MRPIQYRPEIDGLRALAVIPVIFFHAGFPGFSGGFIGVDVFFVISGFLITGILLKEHEAKAYSTIAFYERRARRLLPALLTVLAITSLFAFIVMPPHELLLYGKSLFATLAISANTYFQLTLNYFSIHAEELPLLHMWSLSVEEQFYVIYPLILSVIFFRFGVMSSAFITGLLLLASFASMLFFMSINEVSMGFYSLPTRAWEMLSGALLAHVCHVIPRHKKVDEILSALGVGLIIYAITNFEATSSFPNSDTLIPVAGTLLILGFTHSSTLTAKYFLCAKPMMWIGLISYSLYLWHQPIFAFARITSTSHVTPVQFVVASLLSLALAFLTYRYVEAPFRNKAIKQKTIFVYTGTGILLFAALGLFFYFKEGVPSRYLQANIPTVPTQKERPCLARKDNDIAPGESSCLLNGPREATIAVLGDSHGVELSHALAKLSPNVGIQQVTHSGCPVIGDFHHWDESCRDWYPLAKQYIIESTQIETVIIHYRHTLYLYGEMKKHYPLPPALKGFKTRNGEEVTNPLSRYLNGLDALIDEFLREGKHVILVSPTPEMPNEIGRIIIPKTIFSGMTDNALQETLPLEYYQTYTADIRNYLEEKASNSPYVDYIDSGTLLCTSEFCPAFYRGNPAYFDSNHITPEFAEPIALEINNVLTLKR